MRAEKIVKELLTTDVGVSTITNGIYGGVAPQDAVAPLVVYRKLSALHPSSDSDSDLDPGDGAGNIVRAQMEISPVSEDYEEMKALGEACRLALVNKVGIIAGENLLGIEVSSEGADAFTMDKLEHVQPWVFQVTHTE